MTDNDIIKALECCSSENGKDDCLTCPNFKDFADCKEDLSAIALDLINRQQKKIKKLENIERFATKTIEKQEKEIERLNVELVGMRGACESYKIHYDIAQAEIKRLNGISDRLNDICTNQDLEIERLKAEAQMADGYEDALVKMTKSEAIKEIAERLKKQKQWDVDINDYVFAYVIDNLVKEMTEVK